MQREKEERLILFAKQNAQKSRWESGDIISFRDLPYGTYLFTSDGKRKAAILFHDNVGDRSGVERCYHLGIFHYTAIDACYRKYITVKSGVLYQLSDEAFSLYKLISRGIADQECFSKKGKELLCENNLKIKVHWYCSKKTIFHSLQANRSCNVYEQVIISVGNTYFWMGVLPGDTLGIRLRFYNTATKRTIERDTTDCMLDTRQQGYFCEEYRKQYTDTPESMRLSMCFLSSQFLEDLIFLDMIECLDNNERLFSVTEEELHEINEKRKEKVELARAALNECVKLGLPGPDNYLTNHLSDMDLDELDMLVDLGKAITQAQEIQVLPKKTEDTEISFVIPSSYNKKYYCAAALASTAKRIESLDNGFRITYSSEQFDEINLTYHLFCAFDEGTDENEELDDACNYLMHSDPVFYVEDRARSIRGAHYDAGGHGCRAADYLFTIGKYSAKRFKEKIDEIYTELLEEKNVLPRWSSEFSLYMLIRERVEKADYQYRPLWLDPQSLDIYLPQYNIGIEYQGIQHYEAVERFGGEKGLIQTQIRDRKKKDLCQQNNLILVEWPYKIKVTPENVDEFLQKHGIEVRIPHNRELEKEEAITPRELIPNLLQKKDKKKDQASKVANESIPKSTIRQYGMDGVFISEYLTVHEAAEVVGISPTSINKVIYGERTASGGYQWRRVPYGEPVSNITEVKQKNLLGMYFFLWFRA